MDTTNRRQAEGRVLIGQRDGPAQQLQLQQQGQQKAIEYFL
jgi:hypothetical protein